MHELFFAFAGVPFFCCAQFTRASRLVCLPKFSREVADDFYLSCIQIGRSAVSLRRNIHFAIASKAEYQPRKLVDPSSTLTDGSHEG
jgi:hypothetical protein